MLLRSPQAHAQGHPDGRRFGRRDGLVAKAHGATLGNEIEFVKSDRRTPSEAPMQDLEVVFDSLPSDALTRLVVDGVDLYNIGATGISEWYPVNFFLRSPRGEWLGGLLGISWGGWLHVKHLWVAKAARGRGYGKRLLECAEHYAVEHGCVAATLETHSFQARQFYDKQGYDVVGTLADYPPGHCKFFLRKQLGNSTHGSHGVVPA
jgi:GNAT superfamily N-acetyltransferase